MGIKCCQKEQLNIFKKNDTMIWFENAVWKRDLNHMCSKRVSHHGRMDTGKLSIINDKIWISHTVRILRKYLSN